MQPTEHIGAERSRITAGPPLARSAALLLRAAALAIIASPMVIAVSLLVG